MDGFSISRPPLWLALGLLLVGLGALSLPPLQLAQRADRALYDAWSGVAAASPPTEIVLVYLRDPAWHQALLNLAQHQGARLMISTLPQPPAGGGAYSVLGPVALAGGSAMVVRETDWSQGGHLWVRKDFDGVIRHDWPVLDAETEIPSLALAGAYALGNGSAPKPPIATETLNVDGQGRRWIRFYEPQGFDELTPSEILATPNVLRDRVVIAGRETSARHMTPVGALTTRELIAHGVAGYWQEASISTRGWVAALPWLLAATTLLALALMPLSLTAIFGITLVSTASLGAASAAAFLVQAYWVPVAGPALLVLVSGAYLAWNVHRPPASSTHQPRDTSLTDARRLVARGDLEAAWTHYHRMRVTPMLLSELYGLGRALHAEGAAAMATDVFYRIAQVDAGYRDVTSRLVKPAHDGDAAKKDDGRLRHLGRYQLLEEIGRGAMGVVYLGKDPKINRIVAIKAIDLAAEFDPEYVDEARNRFIREAETAGRLNDPDIVTIFDVGEDRNLAYIAMEFLKGHRLDEVTEPDKLLPVPLVLELLARTAAALHYAHSHNVVHRDIKPANIMYDSASETLKITDFGIARLMDVCRTQTGVVLGTPSFMSPEQLEGENVNGHTDLFALGVSLYQLLTGYLPFRGASMTQLMFVIANEPHVPVTSIRADLPPRIDGIMDVALAKDPASRYESGAEMALALREVAAEFS